MRKLRYLPLLAVPLLLIWVIRSQFPLEDIWTAMRALSLDQLFILASVNLGIILLFSGRWWLILRAQGYTLPYFTLAGYRLAGYAISYFTPGTQFGGEPLLLYFPQNRHHVPSATSAASVALDKLFELLFSFTFLVIGILVILDSKLLPAFDNTSFVWLASGLLSIPLFYLLALWGGLSPLSWLAARLSMPGGIRARLSKIHPFISSTETQISAMFRRKPLTIIAILLLSALIWVFMIAEYWLMLTFLGVELDWVQAVIGLAAARLAFLTPIPGGLGALEASQLLVASALGASPAIGISASLLIRLRDTLLGGLGLWWGALLLGRIPFLSLPSQAGD